jgi:hypothetical protein
MDWLSIFLFGFRNSLPKGSFHRKVGGFWSCPHNFLSLRSARQTRKSGLEARVETLLCGLLNRREVEQLPLVENVILMAGRKFGAQTALI